MDGWMDRYPPGLPGLLAGFASCGLGSHLLALCGTPYRVPVIPGRLFIRRELEGEPRGQCCGCCLCFFGLVSRLASCERRFACERR